MKYTIYDDKIYFGNCQVIISLDQVVTNEYGDIPEEWEQYSILK